MPCLEVSLPTVSDEVRSLLAGTLTTAFSKYAGFPADIFGIRFLEYEWGQAASAGRLCTADDERPYLHMLLYTPRLKQEVKQQLADALTAAFVEAVDKSSWEPVIHFCEHPYDNVAVAGQLLSDTYPQLAEKPFYYPTGDKTEARYPPTLAPRDDN